MVGHPAAGRGDKGHRGPWRPEPTTDEALARFAADARIAEAVSARSRERWLRQQSCEEASLAATCWNLAEAATELAVTTAAGRTHHGVIIAVGDDFVGLQAATGREVLVPLWSLCLLATGADRLPQQRPLRRGLSFLGALAQLAGDRPLVTVACAGVTGVASGELQGVSADLALLAPREGPHRQIYVRLSSVAELSLIASG